MSSLELTPHQLRFVRTFGYLHIRGLLLDSIVDIGAEFDRVMSTHGGASYGGEHRLTVLAGIHTSELLCRLLLDDERIEGLLSSLLGQDYQYWNSELSYCAGDTPWHSDSPWPRDRRTPGWYEILIYLDPLTAETGALRVVPGSHRFDDGYANDVHRAIMDESETRPLAPSETWGVSARDVPSVALPTAPGDVIVLNHMTAHASFGGGRRRRLFTLVFFPRLAGAELDQLRHAHRTRGYDRAALVGPETAIVHDAPAKRLQHLEQVLAHTSREGLIRNLFGVRPTDAA